MDRSRRKHSLESILVVAAILSIAGAWYWGWKRSGADVLPVFQQLYPEAGQFNRLGEQTYTAWSDGPEARLLGYIALAQADGYGGPLKMAVAITPEGAIRGLSIIEHRETPAFMERVLRSKLPGSLTGKSFSDSFQLGADVDAVSGATFTARALAEAALRGSHIAAVDGLQADLPPLPKPGIKIGLAEGVLAALYVVGYFGHQQKFKYKKQARWLTMLAGLVILGFFYNQPLTLGHINQLLLGYWPAWQSHLYWYMLVGGIVFVFTVHNKNPYCEWFCPFGAAQECMGLIGAARVRTPRRYKSAFVWVQRGLAWLAILVALAFRNPGLSSYEIFGTLFAFTGSGLQFALLGLVLVVSIFIKRPWCSYLCPLRPVTDFIRYIRGWVIQIWLKRKKDPIASTRS